MTCQSIMLPDPVSVLEAASLAERAGYPIRFVPCMRMAFPPMLPSIGISSGYIYRRCFM